MGLLKRNVKRSVSIIISASMIMGSMGVSFSENLKNFSDIENHWAQMQIQRLVKKGVISGYSDGTFKPNKQITRAEFIALINKAYNFKLVYDIEFKDVSANDWFYEEIRKAKAQGYISGYEDNTIRPNDLITRQEVAVIMDKVLNISKTDKSQMDNKFKDKDEIESWAKTSVGLLVSHGYLSGYPDETFGPKKNITRAEAAAMLDKVFKSNSTSDITVKKESDNKSNSSSSSSSGSSSSSHKSTKTISKDQYSTEANALKGKFDKLTIDASVGNGDVYLKNVTVTGTTYVDGGGENSIHIKDSKLGNVVVNKEDDKVRLVAEGSTTVGKLILKSGAIIDEGVSVGDKLTESGFGDIVIEDKDKVTLKGDFDDVQVNIGDADIYLNDGEIKKLDLKEKAKNTKVHIYKGAKIDKVEKDSKLSSTTIVNVSDEADFEFSDGTISKYIGTETDIVIPSTIGDKEVTTIGKKAFAKKGLTSVEIPETVESIEEGAFEYCSSLKTVIIPSSVKIIGKNTFYNCANLTSATISEGVESIGEYAFYKCTGLESVTVPSTVNRMGDQSFCSCESLTSLTISDGVKEIGFSAFLFCKSLTSVTIPESVEKIDEWAFSGCDNLAAINVDEDNKNYSDIEGILTNKDQTILIQYLDPCGDQYTVPDGVTKLAKGVFCDTKVTSVKLPESLETIGFSAFEACGGLTSIEIPESVTTIDHFAFAYCDNLKSLIIPQNVKSIGNNAFNGCTNLESVIIDNYEGAVAIGENAIADSVKITYLKEKITPVESEPVSVTSVTKGSMITGSVLMGTFKVSNDDTEVEGDLNWKNPDTIVNETGTFNWEFTPNNTDRFNKVEGTVTVRIKESSSDLDEEPIEMSENVREFYLDLFNKYYKKYTNIVDDMASSYEKLPEDHIFTKGDMKKLKRFYDSDTSLTPELVAPLEYATNLEDFEVLFYGKDSGRSTENFDFLKNCKKLKVLYYLNNGLDYAKDEQSQLKNINSLALLTNLEDLRINMTTLEDITPVSNLKLKYLVLPDNNIEEVNSTIGTIPTLERLDIENNKVSDISAFKNLVNLRSSYLYNNNLSDISPILELDQLEALLINGNHITDITQLKNLNLKRLYINGNPLPENYMDIVKENSKVNTLNVGNITVDDFEWMKTFAVRPEGGTSDLSENNARLYTFSNMPIEIKASATSIKDGVLTIENPLRGLNNEAVLQDEYADEDKTNNDINFKDNNIEIRMDDPSATSIEVKYPIYTEDPNSVFGEYDQAASIAGTVTLNITIEKAHPEEEPKASEVDSKEIVKPEEVKDTNKEVGKAEEESKTSEVDSKEIVESEELEDKNEEAGNIEEASKTSEVDSKEIVKPEEVSK